MKSQSLKSSKKLSIQKNSQSKQSTTSRLKDRLVFKDQKSVNKNKRTCCKSRDKNLKEKQAYNNNIMSFLVNTAIVFFIAFTILFFLTSCTYSVNLVHTAGHASDVVDETDSIRPVLEPSLNVPIKGL